MQRITEKGLEDTGGAGSLASFRLLLHGRMFWGLANYNLLFYF
jgi:hypothetical protein